MEDENIRKKMSRRQRMDHYYMVDVMQRLEYDLHTTLAMATNALPRDWEEIASRAIRPKKTRMTIRIDDDVVRFFKSTGLGFQTRMNDVLRAYMHSRLAGLLTDGLLDADYTGVNTPKRRPQIGDTAKRRGD